MARFSSDPSRVLQEFKEFVKESHRLGMEVYLDVVFNHTGEKERHTQTTLARRAILDCPTLSHCLYACKLHSCPAGAKLRSSSRRSYHAGHAGL